MERQKSIVRRFYNQFKPSFEHDVFGKHKKVLKSFHQNIYPSGSYQQSSKFYNWLYGSGDYGVYTYCVQEGEVVGHQGSLSICFNVAGKKLTAAYAFDLHVDPAWRLKGLAVALTGSLITKHELTIGIGISDEAKAMYQRIGWVDMGELSYYLLFLQAKSIPVKAEDSRFRTLLKYVWIASTVVLLRIENALQKKIKLTSFLVFTAAMAEFINRQREMNYSISQELDYLNWRYDSTKYLKYFLNSDDGEINGILIIRDEYFSTGMRVWSICEFVPTIDKSRTLLDGLIQLALANGVHKIVFNGLDKNLEANLRKRHFVRREYGGRFMFYCEDEEIKQLLQDKKNWVVSGSSSDMDFYALFH
ncbi:hypothetical protein BGP77_11660 [Saccharospirillum sp. MSK14-1]|uniref:GNAT family N-acetyltransferase n=1 Tax=Saccharospirillum sp. MSK14-1 TaxID=1897632 RepID=UPI000D366A17|nr:hypothetical protein [Saccharospirillum sp. MSK14-1]PTY38542.1 hypothetical protein BGP77_11660 [Saccharospirillum sp. MSK14-1]